jgi:hypothetical protein
MPKVMNIFLRISSERQRKRQADCFFSGISRFLLIGSADQFNTAAGLFDLGLGTGADAMDAHFQRHFQFAASQNDNRVAGVAEQVGFRSVSGLTSASALKDSVS